TVMLGWILRMPLLTRWQPGWVPVVFGTGLCCALAGAALCVMALSRKQGRRVAPAVGSALLGYCTLNLFEHLTGARLGIDLAFLHDWLDYGNTRPGLMAPNTSLGFMLVGTQLLLMPAVRSRLLAFTVMTLIFLVLLTGLTGGVGYLLAPDLLFGWARSARMAVPTATAMTVCGLLLWLSVQDQAWYRSPLLLREDDKIRFLAASTLVIAILTAGLSGFVLLQNSMQKALEERLVSNLGKREAAFRVAVAENSSQVQATVDRLKLEAHARGVLLGQAGQAGIREPLARLLDDGVRGVAIHSVNSGGYLASQGRFLFQPELTAAASTDGSVELVWDGGMVLRNHVKIFDRGQTIGWLSIDRPGDALGRALLGSQGLGMSGEAAACIAREGFLHCFPGNRHSVPFMVPVRQAHPLPVQLALAGASGHVQTTDYRQRDVVAAYTLLAPGLGAVLKEDTVEVYGPVREAFARGVPLMLALAALAAALLVMLLKPLVGRLLATEERATRKEAEVTAILAALADGILTIDREGRIISSNSACDRMFLPPGESLAGRAFDGFVVCGDAPAWRFDAGQDGAAAGIEYEATGLRADGSFLPLAIKFTPVDGAGHVAVALLRDITEQKEAHRKLVAEASVDSLTGLPNRSAFLNRLRQLAGKRTGQGLPLVLMFLDLDGFKEVNDRLGHLAGDELLSLVAQRLLRAVRKTDMVARLGGDEFTLLLPDLANPASEAARIADDLLQALRLPFQLASGRVQISASVGIVVQHGAFGEDRVDELMGLSDLHMYRAKKAGKDRSSFIECSVAAQPALQPY
ncbi:MAG: sensor diguanylate cyclase, partial [Paucimonas sp.]|nr:sensor diguanylate cyclase [Paucimonas sp.]